MIQINLIPDIKKEYLHAKHMRNTAISVAILAGLATAGLVVALVLFLGVQFGRDALADNTIKNEYAALNETEDLSNLVTIQNQLEVISNQHAEKTIHSRLFALLQAVNSPAPNNVRFTSVKIDADENVISIEGIAPGRYPTVEALKKTLLNSKFEYKERGEDTANTVPLVEKVVVGESSFAEDSTGARVLRFAIEVVHEEKLFSNQAVNARIITPSSRIDVTDSRTRIPESLFTSRPADSPEGEE
jgi:hypothetical protein